MEGVGEFVFSFRYPVPLSFFLGLLVEISYLILLSLTATQPYTLVPCCVRVLPLSSGLDTSTPDLY